MMTKPKSQVVEMGSVQNSQTYFQPSLLSKQVTKKTEKSTSNTSTITWVAKKTQ